MCDASPHIGTKTVALRPQTNAQKNRGWFCKLAQLEDIKSNIVQEKKKTMYMKTVVGNVIGYR